MAQRKKKPAYNPKQIAKKTLRESMKSIVGVREMFIYESGRFAEKLDEEQRNSEACLDKDLKGFTDEAFAESKAAYLGLISQIKTAIDAHVVESDGEAMKQLALLDNVPWKECKDQIMISDLAMADNVVGALAIGQNFIGMTAQIFDIYNRKIEFVKAGLKEGKSIDLVRSELAALLAEAKEDVEPVTETIEEAAHV